MEHDYSLILVNIKDSLILTKDSFSRERTVITELYNHRKA